MHLLPRFRFRIRTLLLVVAVVAILLAMYPYLWWRWKVYSALETALANGPDSIGVFQPRPANRPIDYDYLRSDYPRVMKRLLSVAQSNEDYQRQMNAVQTMHWISQRLPATKVEDGFTSQLIELACKQDSSPQLSIGIAPTIKQWIRKTGAAMEDRRRIIQRSKTNDRNEKIAWIGIMASIGGREEVERLLELGDSEPSLMINLHNSSLRDITWPGMLPHLNRWIRDPMMAGKALEFSVLHDTKKGREILLEFVFDDKQPIGLRTKAAFELTRTVVGNQLLATACLDDAKASKLNELLGDGRQWLVVGLEALRRQTGDQMILEMIEGLDPKFWLPGSIRKHSPKVESELSLTRERYARWSRVYLNRLFPNSGMESQVEWQEWSRTSALRIVEYREVLEWLLEDSDLVSFPPVFRAIHKNPYGFIPEDCLPSYRQMLSSNDQTLQIIACEALVAHSSSTEDFDKIMELLEQANADDSSGFHPRLVNALQRRFAVNYFKDNQAWKEWYSTERQSEGKGLSE